ncbi:toxin-antitoxin system YwqK family antitoxin [Elusimicrobiota bacterium]
MEGLLLAIALFVVVMMPSSKDRAKEGMYSTYYGKGKILSERHYKAGKLEGVYKTYYEDGKAMSEFVYLDGKREGVAKLFYRSGNLYSETTFENGIQNGIKKIYFDSKARQAQYIDTYKNGQAINRKEYDEDGKLKTNKNFKYIHTKKHTIRPRH